MRYQAVLFDFDYTLGDSTDAVYAGFQAGFREMGLPEPEREAVRRTIGYPLELAFTMLTGDEDGEKRQLFRALFLKTAHPLTKSLSTLFPGAVDLLLSLKRAGVRTGIVSTKHTQGIEEIMEKYDALKYVDLVVGGDLVAAPKPDPEGLNAALRQLGIKPAEALFCGDTTIDAKTALAAGTHFCAVLNGTTPAEDFQELPSRHISADLPDLQAWLGL